MVHVRRCGVFRRSWTYQYYSQELAPGRVNMIVHTASQGSSSEIQTLSKHLPKVYQVKMDVFKHGIVD